MARILFIVNHFYPEVGAIRTEYELIKEISKRGHQVLVLTTFPRKYRLPEGISIRYPFWKFVVVEEVENIKILRIKSYVSSSDNLFQRTLELITSFFTLLIASLILTPMFDVLFIAGDIELVISQIGILNKMVHRKPLIVILHDIHPDALVKSGLLKNTLILKTFEVLIRPFSKYVDKVIVHSESNKKILIKRYRMKEEKVGVVNLWADLEGIKTTPKYKIPELKEKYVGCRNCFVVTFAGVMNPPQGLEVVIHAAYIIKQKYMNKLQKIRFLLVGDGIDKENLIDMSKELGLNKYIKFLPLQPRQKYFEILAISDVCLVTLKKDYFQPVVPSKLFEIMAMGKPAILSMPLHSDAVKIIRRFRCGIYAGNGDPNKLAEIIVKLYNDAELRESLGKNGKTAVKEFFNLSRATNEYISILNETFKIRLKM